MGMLTTLTLLAGAAALEAPSIPPGTYSNEEDVYFARDAKKTPPPWLSVVIDGDAIEFVDATGASVATPAGIEFLPVTDGVEARLPGGDTSLLRKGRAATCWASVRREKPKADGGEDWAFYPGLKLHDQGGRALAAGKDAQPAVLRVRNVVWPSGNNRPSLVLYIHKPENPDHAESYAWADPGAVRIGVNLRWIQASCTIDGTEKPTPALMGERK